MSQGMAISPCQSTPSPRSTPQQASSTSLPNSLDPLPNQQWRSRMVQEAALSLAQSMPSSQSMLGPILPIMFASSLALKPIQQWNQQILGPLEQCVLVSKQ